MAEVYVTSRGVEQGKNVLLYDLIAVLFNITALIAARYSEALMQKHQ